MIVYLVGAVDFNDRTYCLPCLEGLPLDMRDDIEENEAHRVGMVCDNCGGNLIDEAEKFNDPRRTMSLNERIEDELGEIYT